MSSTVGVVVPTFGDLEVWGRRAGRAVASAQKQTRKPDAIVHQHGKSLADARNRGARHAGTDWLIFLDADDELHEGYVEAMLAGEGDLRQPATLGVYPTRGEDDEPVVLPRTNLIERNHLVIGTMVSQHYFHVVGGFHEWPVAEDWAFFLSCFCAGAEIGQVPDAIYRVTVMPRSRNTMSGMYLQTYNDIRKRYAAAHAERLRRAS